MYAFGIAKRFLLSRYRKASANAVRSFASLRMTGSNAQDDKALGFRCRRIAVIERYIMAEDINISEEDGRVLRQRDENPLKPVHSNMVENLKEEIIQAYEAALEANDKDVIKRMEWEFSTIGVYKKELKEYVARRKAQRENITDAPV